MLNHANVIVYEKKKSVSSQLFRKYSFLREMNYEHFMVCLRLITTHDNDTNNMKNEFKIQGLPQ